MPIHKNIEYDIRNSTVHFSNLAQRSPMFEARTEYLLRVETARRRCPASQNQCKLSNLEPGQTLAKEGCLGCY